MGFFDFFENILPKSFVGTRFDNTRGIYKAIARQFDDLKEAIVLGQDQLFIDSATYMLPVYEAEFAIQLVDQSSTEARRNNVMAMSRGGLGSTKESITNVLKSYGYTTEIVEDFGNYRVTIKFTDIRGVPTNINDLKNLLWMFIPGHLELKWSFIYTQYRELKPYTHQQLTAHTHEYYKTQLPS